MPPKLVIEVVGDVSHLERSFKRANRASQGFGRNVNQAGRGALTASVGFRGLGRSVAFASGAFLGGAGVISVMKSSVSAASSLAEQTSKTNVVFEKSAATILSWSKTTSSSIGLASDQALKAVSTFGLLFRNIGQGAQPAADFSQTLVNLGADLASFNDTSVDEALQAIRSGLTGEIEPLRKYGVFLSEAATKTQALADTGKASAEQLTIGEKVLARYKLIMRDTARAQGDFARTSDGLANQQRILTANVRQLQIGIGQALIPEVLRIVQAMNDWLSSSDNQKRVTDQVRAAVVAVRGVVEGAIPIVQGAAEAAKKFADAVGGAKDALIILGTAFAGLKIANFVSGMAATGAAADAAASRVGALRAGLLRLGAIGVIAVGVDIFFNRDKTNFEAGEVSVAELAKIRRTFGDKAAAQIRAAQEEALRQAAFVSGVSAIEDVRSGLPSKNALLGLGIKKPGLAGAGRAGQLPTGVGTLSAVERNALALAQGETVGALSEQRRLLAGQIEKVQRQLSGARGKKASDLAVTLQALYADDASALARIRSLNEGAARDAKSAADATKAATKKRNDAIRDLVASAIGTTSLGVAGGPLTLGQVNKAIAAGEQGRQFRALGLTSEGGQRAPGLKGLKAMLGNLEGDVKGTALDTDKMRSRFATIRKVISGEFGKAREDVRRTVKGMLDDIDSQLGERQRGTGFRHADPNNLAKQLGFGGGRDATRKAASVLAQIGRGGTIPKRSQAFAGAGGITIHGGLHLNNVQNVRQLENELEKRKKGRPVVRRGLK